ncbi:glycosyl transferase [Salinibacterium xinjiangense]|uniref:Polysaccharide deacetylase n=1 Tax=Salinibacterium xinjiangense TaxID=386302 RepID=A0A2C8YQI6_9MICO|nr:polysaccharide deacetylase family protein [Salinibacterium xinjiangense]GGK98160.1 glycosyl transferase [Salinibacterium xinjiangense]SOE52758.1 Polysaccharide deacetylase [Salinibacterium xinjiangense]
MITNLCFHGVGVCAQEREPGEARYWVSEPAFLRILDLVLDRPDVSISFDDGNRSDLDIAYPALKERNLPATFFALAGRLEDSASLNPVDLRELRAQGMDVGTHGWSHIPWTRLSPADVVREFSDARELLAEASGGEILDAALPLGRYDRRALSQLRDARYRTVFTSDRFRANAGSWLQARYSVTATDTVDSMRTLLSRRATLLEARNVTASLVKRIR